MIVLGDAAASFTQYVTSQCGEGAVINAVTSGSTLMPEATTIVAVRHSGGRAASVIADRRASQGHRIANDDMTKLFLADRLSAVGIAGTAGIGIELARLFALELEHIEKIERRALSHEGKVRRLSSLVRTHLPLAIQGLSAIPLLAGFDASVQVARLHTFDATGGAYEEHSSAAIGSGGDLANAVLMAECDGLEWAQETAEAALVRALMAAAQRDAATVGVSGTVRPLIVRVDASGAHYAPQEAVETAIKGVVQ